ncbi:MAG TPA: tryptophanase [Oceanospirillales bacterium]|nr:tryptophanase [Oceanospirillales bacterium]
MQHKTIIEPFRIKSVEPIEMSTEQQRFEYLQQAHNNLFLIESKKVIIDLLTDSGTSAMSAEQWAGIMRGDESYAGARSWERMRDEVRDLTGCEYIIPTHQGRAGESILYTQLGGAGKTFISNTHFDTTRANIEYSGASAIDCLTEVGMQPAVEAPFKGNMDIEKLERTITEHGAENIAAVILTVTNNSGGGQPVSMQNAKDVKSICDEHGILYLLDCCRIAENSYFIAKREAAYKNRTYREIAQEMFSLVDGSIMSAKKDALVNMGGFIALKSKTIADSCTNTLIIKEGFVTYGGLSGRDMEALAIGLKEVFDKDYLHYRITSTTYLGDRLHHMGIPVMRPIGGHAVYIDAKALYPHIAVNHYPGQALACDLYLKGGIRGCEIGSIMFGKYDDDGQLIPAPMELVRLAIPRRVYTQSHIDYVIETFAEILKERNQSKGIEIIYEPKFLRHFTAHYKRLA